MSSISKIIATHRARMESAGLLRRAEVQPLSPQVAAMRPSLTKVQAALAERPDRFSVVQPSPMAILFDITLPKLEPVLMELGEVKAERIIIQLCEHGRAMIEGHGINESREHLEELFKDLPDYEVKLREEGGVEEAIDAYEKLNFEGRGEGYLRLKLGKKIATMKVNDDGMISISSFHLSIFPEITMNPIENQDLIFFRKAINLRELVLAETMVRDTGLEHLRGLVNLQELDLGSTLISDAGLAHLRGLINLWRLRLLATKVSDSGLMHLRELNNLQVLDLGATKISDAGLMHLRGLVNLRDLGLWATKISNAGLAHLRGLINLQRLVLSGTEVGDTGLEYLRGLVNLRELYLRDARVTGAGIEELKRAIPGLEVIR